MSKYELGIMTARWTVEAPNVDVAMAALRVYGKYPGIPIANFSNDERSPFSNMLGASREAQQYFFEFLDENTEPVRSAIKTIEAVS